MSSAAVPTVKDKELVAYGLVEAASVNSFADFKTSNFDESKVTPEKAKKDFVNTFICHLIFYSFYCIAIAVHIFIDLGLRAFLKNKLSNFIGPSKKAVVDKSLSFA